MTMCEDFDIQFTGLASELVEKIKKGVTDNGGSFEGDAALGDISISVPFGSIVGKYTITGQNITISISKRPGFLSCSIIQDKIKQMIN